MGEGGTRSDVNAAANRKRGIDEGSQPSWEELAAANTELRARLEETQEALRASEERLDAMVQLVPAILFIADSQLHLENVSHRFHQFTGADPERISGRGWMDFVHPDDLERVRAAINRSRDTGVPLELEARVRAADGRYRWFMARAEAQRNADGSIERWFGSTWDIHEQWNAADRQRTQLTEHQHRVRNILAIVRSVFARTVESHSELNGASDHFRGRLDALARTHGVLLRTAEGCIELDEMIWNELISHGAPLDGAIAVVGPAIRLRGKVAESLGLTFHELAANASKYGALADNPGRIEISWGVRGSTAPRLELVWEESGVPTVDPAPSHSGFGRELIEEGLPYQLGADTKLVFSEGGVRCSIGLPLGPDVLVADGVATAEATK